MPVTADGWPSIANYTDPRLGVYRVPGTTAELQLLREAAPIFVAYAAEWNRLVNTLEGVGFVGGFDPRTIAGSSTLSSHASATAIDLGATRFPQHADRMTSAQKAAVHRLLVKYEVLEWGGDWSPSYLDQMHTQLRQSSPPGRQVVSSADVARVIAKLGLSAASLSGPAPVGAGAVPLGSQAAPGVGAGCRWSWTLPSLGPIGGGTVCMDKSVGVLAVAGGGLVTASGLALIGAVVLQKTGAGRAATKAAAVLPAGRVAKAAGGAAAGSQARSRPAGGAPARPAPADEAAPQRPTTRRQGVPISGTSKAALSKPPARAAATREEAGF